MLNLLADRWLPVRRLHTGPATIAPLALTEDLGTDPVIDLDWPRADFRIAALEFLIGLLATACPPRDGNAWLDAWEVPPDAATLKAAFAPIVHAFELDGAGPRFLQDAEDLVSGPEPVERLLIDAPGGSTVSKNTDLLSRRDRVTTLGRPAAAMALFTLQAWAPSGGAGNRVGLRGGGPMTTLVLPAGRPALWHLLWANVPLGQPPTKAELPHVFPWLAPTLTSAGGRAVTPEVAHKLQAWWGMPRRIRLDYLPCDPSVPCGLTGEMDSVQVATWRQRPYGANYEKWGGEHPLTPHYRVKPNAEILPLHPQPGGVGYRHWLGLVVRDEAGLRVPADTVTTWRGGRRQDAATGPVGVDRLLAAGYDMDNMKARGFVESEMPLPGIADPAIRDRVDALARGLVRSADLVAGLLRRAVRDALFGSGATVKLDWEMLSAVREQLWEGTEAAFHEALSREAAAPEVLPSPEAVRWQVLLRRTALAIFGTAAPLDADGSSLAKSDDGIRRILRAKRNLLWALEGTGKDGAALFEMLDLAPRPKPPRKGRAA